MLIQCSQAACHSYKRNQALLSASCSVTHLTMHPAKNYPLILIVTTLLLVGLFLYLYVQRSYRDFVESQDALMNQSTTGAARILEMFIKETQRDVVLFVEKESGLIAQLSKEPGNQDLEQQFSESLQKYFPNYFAYSITDSSGAIQLDDFDGRIGEVCRNDISQATDHGGNHKVWIHPNPLGYHFDIMTDWEFGEGEKGIFFVSFNPQTLAKVLGSSQLHEHQLILLNKDRPGLIEITAAGTRKDLQRDVVLSEEELARIRYATDIEGSRWSLVDLPDENLFPRYKEQTLARAIYIFLVFLVFSSLMYLLIRKEETRRAAAEAAVKKSHDELEKRVDFRTRELSDANQQLEKEVQVRQNAERALTHEIVERKHTETALRELHRITAANDLDFNGKIRSLLSSGCAMFKLPIGILSRITGETYEVIEAVSPDEFIIPGSVLDLGATYCRETIKADGPIGFESAHSSEWKTHPCYREHKLETYIGIVVKAGGKIYGTLNFSGFEPRNTRFSPVDKEILTLMSQWVGSEIAQQRAEVELQQSESKYRNLFEHANDSIFIIDPDNHRILDLNELAASQLGYTKDELLRMTIDEIVAAEGGNSGRLFTRNVMETGSDVFEHVYIRKDGSKLPVEISSRIINTGGHRVLQNVVRDITERKKLESMRNRFLSIASHELRTPLTNMSLSLELIARDTKQDLAPGTRAMIDIAYRSSERLKRLVSDILDIQKFEAGEMPMKLKTVELLPVIEEAIESTRAYAEQFRVSLRLEEMHPDVYVLADSDRLMQVLTNLLSNAARFSPAGGSVLVSMTRHADWVRISVTDHGQGIPAEFRDSVFEPFTQADPSLEDDRHRESAGLGLSIAKAIVDGFGGEIGFSTNPGIRTTFYFDLEIVKTTEKLANQA